MSEPADRVACARQIDLHDGRRIWVPPTGRPFWCHCQPVVELTDEELAAYGLVRINRENQR